MIRTKVIPCLPSGLAKNNKIMSMFVLFPRFFRHLESLAFFLREGEGGGGGTLLQSSQTGCFDSIFQRNNN